MSRLQAALLLILIVGAAVGLRSYDVKARSLWFDEAFSWRLIHFPFQEMIARDAQDVHPPLYYIVLQGWSAMFGTSLLALRMFSVLCSGITVAGVYVFSAYVFRSRKVGFLAALLTAVSGWNISYAWEARMYPLGMIFALFSSYALLRAMRERKVQWFALYAILATCLAYTHYYGFFTIFAQIVFVGFSLIHDARINGRNIFKNRITWYSLAVFIFALIAYSPWLSTFLHQSKQVQIAYWVPPVAITSVPDTFYQFFLPTKEIPPHHWPIIVLSLLPIIGTVFLWVWLIMRKSGEKDGAVLTALLGCVPFIIGIIISLSGRSLYNDRFFAFAGIFVFCGLAYAFMSIPNKTARKIVILLSIVGLSASFVRYWNELDIAHKPGAHGATQYVFEQRSNEDSVIVSSPYVYFAIENYATEEFVSPNVPHLFSQTGELSHFSGGPIIIPSDIVGPKDIATYAGTVWVVDTTGYTETPFQAPKNWVEVSKKTFPEVFVYQGDIIVREFSIK